MHDADVLSAPDQPSNIHNVEECRDLALWLVQVAEPFEAIVRNIHTSLQASSTCQVVQGVILRSCSKSTSKHLGRSIA